MPRYSHEEIAMLADSVLQTYPNLELAAAHGEYMWDEVVLPEAWENRTALTPPLIAAVLAGIGTNLAGPADAIHEWGFGGRPIKDAVRNQMGFFDALLQTLDAFLGNNPANVANREVSLTNLMDVPGIGIATASKWICFVDPIRYGIYDSRVSIALRNVHLDAHRAFPIVGRRGTQNHTPFRQDNLLNTSIRAARAYLDYLDVLARVADATGVLCPAEVEMALFMLGDVWADGQPPPTPLRWGMWA